MLQRCGGALILALLLPQLVPAQDAPPLVKRAQAVRVPNGALVLDGRLDDEAWRSAPPITDFLQKQPDEGKPPTERTEIRLAYDDGALYVGARMFAKDPSKIQAPVGRRDNIGQMEHVIISLDTYRDRRTAYSFAVTASGVRGDFYYPTDNEQNTDASFDPVWDARTTRDSLGWTAEMRIPFNQLRFNAADVQTWGLNFDRWIPSTNEDIFWIPVPSNVTAWASRMGTLEGISGIQPSHRIELLPYVASEGRRASDRDPRNPYDDGRNLQSRIGGDMKLGLGPSLTLQATVNPDFGQVEADPSVVNLSAYELFYADKRPFFTEGSQYLSGGGATYFYSKRIGGPPRGALLPNADFVDAPSATTILGAAKLTGRLPTGLRIGALAAATAREEATSLVLPDPSAGTGATRATQTVQPRADYGVVRLQQEIGTSASTVGLIATSVHRALGSGDRMASWLPRDAATAAVDWNLRFKKGEYQLSGDFGVSHVAGDTIAIRRMQTNSARYYQRPDAGYVDVDPTRTQLNGINSSLSLERANGRHWLWSVFAFARTPGFDVNDAGAMSRADTKQLDGALTYRERKPNAFFQNYSATLETYGQMDFGNVRNAAFVRADGVLTWKNFWYTNLTAWQDLPSQSSDLTRGGPYMGTGYYRVGIAEVGNSFASPTHWSGRVYYGRTTLGEKTQRFSGSVGVRPGPQWQLTLTPNYLTSRDPRQYVGASRAPARTETFGTRYQFATIDFHEFTLSTRLNYAFGPDLTLEMFVEPYAASGSYSGFGELSKPRSRELIGYGRGETVAGTRVFAIGAADAGRLAADTITVRAPDFNERSLRTNAVLRWEWRPGSLFYAVWQRQGSRSLNRYRRVDPTDAFGAFEGPYTNFFAVKMSLWIPMGG